jgi:hypothetical protein
MSLVLIFDSTIGDSPHGRAATQACDKAVAQLLASTIWSR